MELTRAEHLAAIRATCVRLLEIAKGRTAGEWEAEIPDPVPLLIKVSGKTIVSTETIQGESYHDAMRRRGNDVAFIAACAGAAEAGWLATIEAVELCWRHGWDEGRFVDSIIAAWPVESLAIELSRTEQFDESVRRGCPRTKNGSSNSASATKPSPAILAGQANMPRC